jgi:hypothetical protein
MAQQQVQQRKTVRRIDECAREQQAREHDEMMSRARRASRKAQQSTANAQRLIMEISEVI